MSIEITGAINFSGSTTLIGDLPETSWILVDGSTTGGATIASYGQLYIWGQASTGQLGNNTTTPNMSSPTQIPGSWTNYTGGRLHSVALKFDGTMWSWGDNTNGQLGLNDKNHRSSPVQIGTSSWTQIYSWWEANLAIRADGTLWAWGDNLDGQLGLGEGADLFYSSPVQVGTSTWTALPRGENIPHAAAIRSDGSLWQWGNQTFAPMPGTPNIDGIVPSPVLVSSSSWVAIATHSAGAAAIRIDGALFTWGIADLLLGDFDQATSVDRSSPVQVGTSSWTSVTAGTNSVYAIRSDGGLFAWGYNGSGELGLNDRNHRSSPVQIGTSSWLAVGTSDLRAWAIRADNTIWGWGYNLQGRLGVNASSPTYRSSPVQVAVPTLSVWP